MSGTTPGTGGSHYNPDEPRDWHGRWTTGGSSWRDTPLRDPSAAGRARTLLGHARIGAWQKGVLSDVAWPTPAEAARFSRLLTAWNAASGLDDAPFAAWFTRGLDIGPATRRRRRRPGPDHRPDDRGQHPAHRRHQGHRRRSLARDAEEVGRPGRRRNARLQDPRGLP